MNTLTAHRARLVEVLSAADINAVAYLQERPNPPVALVVPGSPYLTGGPQFGTFKVAYSVLLITRTAVNEVSTAELDQMIATSVVALSNASDVDVAQADAPAQMNVNGAVYLTSIIDVTVTSHIDTEEG